MVKKSVFLSLSMMLVFFLAACENPFAPSESDLQKSLSIGYAEPISSYSPLNFEAKNRKYLANFYEPLVRFDKSFNFETALAVSWGRLDDLTWQFKLRDGVIFHDGTDFEADDVLYSLDRARFDESSQLFSLLTNIESVTKVDDRTIQIKTLSPDPLLLNKLTNIYIMPSAYRDFDTPMGSGPYYLTGFEEGTLQLSRFPEYWGSAAYYDEVNLAYIPNVDDRLAAILNKDLQILANVPPQFVQALEEGGVTVEAYPSLELSYLFFNQDGIFADENLREAVWLALRDDYAEFFGHGFLKEVYQFAPAGIFGFVPDLPARETNRTLAQEARKKHVGPVEVTLDIPQGLEVLGEAIKEDLAWVDIFVTVNALPQSEFENKILSGQSDFYFFGWKYDLADAADFFETVMHSKEASFGSFNGLSLNDRELDEWIELAAETLDIPARRELLEQINSRLIEQRVGVPLFESQVIYGIRPEVHWAIRLDGQILASEIIQNMVE